MEQAASSMQQPLALPQQARAAPHQRPAPTTAAASDFGLYGGAQPSSAQKNDDETELLMYFTTSAPAGPALLSAPSAELHDALPGASSRDLEDRSVSLCKELSAESESANPTGGVSGNANFDNKRKRDELDSVGRPPPCRAANGALPAPPEHPPEVWWSQDSKTNAWKEYDARDTAELEHAWELAVRYPSTQLQSRTFLPVQGGLFSVDIAAMEQLGHNGQPTCKVQRCAVTAADIKQLPCSKDMLPKPAGPAVAGLLYEIASHAGLRQHTGLSIQTMPHGCVGFRLDLSGKERDEPDIEEKGNYIAELLNAVFCKIGKEVDFGCTSNREDQAKPTLELPLADNPKDEDSMLALLGQGDSQKADIRTVRVQRCLDAENRPVYKRTIFKWAPNKNGGGRWRRYSTRTFPLIIISSYKLSIPCRAQTEAMGLRAKASVRSSTYSTHQRVSLSCHSSHKHSQK